MKPQETGIPNDFDFNSPNMWERSTGWHSGSPLDLIDMASNLGCLDQICITQWLICVPTFWNTKWDSWNRSKCSSVDAVRFDLLPVSLIAEAQQVSGCLYLHLRRCISNTAICFLLFVQGDSVAGGHSMSPACVCCSRNNMVSNETKTHLVLAAGKGKLDTGCQVQL